MNVEMYGQIYEHENSLPGLDVEFGGGIFVMDVYFGPEIPKTIQKKIVDILEDYQLSISRDMWALDRISQGQARDRRKAEMYPLCEASQRHVSASIEALGFGHETPDEMQVYNTHYRVWDPELERYNIFRVFMRYKYLR